MPFAAPLHNNALQRGGRGKGGGRGGGGGGWSNPVLCGVTTFGFHVPHTHTQPFPSLPPPLPPPSPLPASGVVDHAECPDCVPVGGGLHGSAVPQLVVLPPRQRCPRIRAQEVPLVSVLCIKWNCCMLQPLLHVHAFS